MGDIDGAKYSPGWGSWNVSQAGSLSLLQGGNLSLLQGGNTISFLFRNLDHLDQPVKETGDFVANMHPWYYVLSLYKTIGHWLFDPL